jgi:hypothetical protein
MIRHLGRITINYDEVIGEVVRPIYKKDEKYGHANQTWKLTHRIVRLVEEKFSLDIGAIAVSSCTNPTLTTVFTPASWTVVNTNGLGDRRRGGRDRLVTVNANQVTTKIMLAAKRAPA